jgi:pyruvate dehydrogenase E1 component alpha subunit
MANKTDKEKEPEAPAQNNGAEGDGQTLDMPEPDEMQLSFSFTSYEAGDYDHEELGLEEDQLLAMYRNMLLQRRFEERAAQMYGKQKIAGFLHLYIGQEAVSTGAANALTIGQDSVITAYRDHGIALALGMTANECMAELFGRIDGCSRGKGGSMHFFDAEKKFFGGHGIVGGHIPVGVGIAFAHKYKEDDGACLTFFGDGAVGQGAFHEAANLAGLYDLPVVLIVENNQYAMGTAAHRAFADPEFFKQAIPYDMPSSVVNGMDVLACYKAFSEHLAMAHDNQPSLLEVRTYRYRGHSMSDPAKYRTKEELESKKNDDPIIRLKQYLIEHDLSDNETLDGIDDEVKQEVLDSVDFADESDFPPLETIYEDVYVQDDYPFLA